MKKYTHQIKNNMCQNRKLNKCKRIPTHVLFIYIYIIHRLKIETGFHKDFRNKV